MWYARALGGASVNLAKTVAHRLTV
jgi:hypothetical protein